MYISRGILCKFEECNKISSKIIMMKKIMINKIIKESILCWRMSYEIYYTL